MTNEQNDVAPRPVHRRTLRLTFRSTAGEVQLVAKERLDMICPPSVGASPEIGRNGGFWVETRDDAASTRFFRVLDDPMRRSVEVHSPDGDIHREFGQTDDVTFEVLVPDDPAAVSIVLIGDGGSEAPRTASTKRKREQVGAQEIATFDLSAGAETETGGPS